MGMPCEVNSILKLNHFQELLTGDLAVQSSHQAEKEGYRIIPIDTPIPLVDENWMVRAEVVIRQLIWETCSTKLTFEIVKVYSQPAKMKIEDKKAALV